ncbi:MAG: hypothetical protein WCQ80_01190 [Bacilli bacterium]
MEEYLNKGKEILKILISNGYEAYFIGDAVRQIILQQPYDEIEITTSATPDAIKGIFQFTKLEDFSQGLIKVAYYGYDFFLSTFQMIEKKDKKSPMKQHYSKRLLDDLACRDFTINAIAMSHSGKLTDAYKGYEDIRKKRIQPIGKSFQSVDQVPILMIRAIRLVSAHHYKMSFSVRRGIRRYRKHIKEVDRVLLVQELKKLFQGKYYKYALDELITLGLYKHIESLDKAFRYQDRHRFKSFDFESFLLISFLLNKEIDESYLPFVEDPIQFKKIYRLAIANPKCIYNSLDYFSNGLETCLEANRLNVYLKRAKRRHKKIIKEYRDLPIHEVCDLAFKGEDILKLTNGQDGPFLPVLIDKIIATVLSGDIVNDYDVLKVFSINELKSQNIALGEAKIAYDYPDIDEVAVANPSLQKEEGPLDQQLDYDQLEQATSEQELSQTLYKQGQIIKDYTDHRLDMLERRLNEQDRLLKEKDIKMAQLEKEGRERRVQEDIERLVNKNMDMLKESNYLNNPQKDKSQLSRKLHQAYLDYIHDFEDKYTKNEEQHDKN